jgi:hypothetical protein
MKIAAFIATTTAFWAEKVPYLRHAAAFFRMAAVSSYLGAVWTYIFGHGSTQDHGLIALGSALLLVAHITHQIIVAVEALKSTKEHIRDWLDPEEQPALIKTWIFLFVVMAHLALIVCL